MHGLERGFNISQCTTGVVFTWRFPASLVVGLPAVVDPGDQVLRGGGLPGLLSLPACNTEV